MVRKQAANNKRERVKVPAVQRAISCYCMSHTVRLPGSWFQEAKAKGQGISKVGF